MKRSRKTMLVVASLSATVWAPSTYATYPDCPTGGAAAMNQWRDEAAAAAIDQGWGVADVIKGCFPTEIPSCLQRIADDSAGQPSVDYASNFPTEQKRLPRIFKGPGNSDDQFQIPENIEDIIQGTARPPAVAGEQVNYRKWKLVKYKSRSTGGFDLGAVGPGQRSTESLMLILAPGDSFTPPLGYDRWINIGLPSDQVSDRFKPEPQQKLPKWSDYSGLGGALPVTLTMLTLQKASGDQKARILFQNFSRGDSSSPIYTGSPSNPSSCQSCHANGMRAISPLGYFAPGVAVTTLNDGNRWMDVNNVGNGLPVPTLPAATQAIVSDMNNVMSSYGRVDWGTVVENGKSRSYVDPYIHGAGLGPMAPAKPRDDAFFASCMNLQSAYTYSSIREVETVLQTASAAPNKDRVKAAMNCGMCHGGSRAPINRQFSRNEVEFKVLIDHSMPMIGGNGMTDADRLALVNCLYAEQKDNDKSWLSQMACQDTVAHRPKFKATRYPAQTIQRSVDDPR